MLNLILTEKPFVLLIDSLQFTGVNLFLSLIKNQATKTLHFFCYEQHSNKYKSLLNCRNIIYYDRHKNKMDPDSIFQDDKSYETLIEPFSLLIKENQEKIKIIIDSLAYLILEFGINNVYKLIHSLKNNPKVEQIVSLCHGDMIPEMDEVEKKLTFLSTILVKIEYINDEQGKAIIQKTFSNGKIEKKIEGFIVDNELGLKTIELITKKPPEQPIDPLLKIQKLTTFKLTLTESEKADRARVVLPFTQMQNEQAGQIFYIPDENDDFDEEDPDDDDDDF